MHTSSAHDEGHASAITEALATNSIGTMQKVLQAKGFRRVASWPRLVRAAKVTSLIKVNLPAGLAFGTGHHPSTRMCLRWHCLMRLWRRRRS